MPFPGVPLDPIQRDQDQVGRVLTESMPFHNEMEQKPEEKTLNLDFGPSILCRKDDGDDDPFLDHSLSELRNGFLKIPDPQSCPVGQIQKTQEQKPTISDAPPVAHQIPCPQAVNVAVVNEEECQALLSDILKLPETKEYLHQWALKRYGPASKHFDTSLSVKAASTSLAVRFTAICKELTDALEYAHGESQLKLKAVVASRDGRPDVIPKYMAEVKAFGKAMTKAPIVIDVKGNEDIKGLNSPSFLEMSQGVVENPKLFPTIVDGKVKFVENHSQNYFVVQGDDIDTPLEALSRQQQKECIDELSLMTLTNNS